MNIIDGATLVGPPIALLIAYLGSRFRPRREIEVESLEATLINPPQSYKDLTLLVRHADEEIEQPVVSALVFVRNTGNRDISRDDFVEPLKICAPPNHQILSCRFGGPIGAKLDTKAELGEFQDGREAIYVRWNLLKPRQHFSFRLMMAKTDDIFSINTDEQITYTALLKDVRERSGWHNFISRLLLNYIILAVMVGASILLIPPLKFWEPTFSNADGDKVIITKKDQETTKACDIVNGQRLPESCRLIPEEELDSLSYVGFEPITWQERFPSNPFRYWWVVLFPILGVAFDFRRHIARLVRRLIQLARSGFSAS
tara:strand:- start:1499 stop:2443 length:945 start_codon:yes stop_codon:yes gene_type:complete